LIERTLDLAIGEDDDHLVADNDNTAIMLHRGLLSNVEARCLELPGTPPDWIPPPRKFDEPEFSTINNPGEWSEFTFRPEFNKSSYLRHSLPTGCTPVPKNDQGIYKYGEWEFFYKGWENDDPNQFRCGASSANMFPASRQGCLDANLLRKLGLTKKRVTEQDALFFYQLLLPLCDTRRSGITNDKRMSFYSEVESFSNAYALSIGLGGSYGHTFKLLKVIELIHFDGVIVRDGVRGGSNGALY
jgi:hypothetical protein